MSKSSNFTANAPSQLPGLHGLKFSFDWITRPVFGLALAAVAIGSIAAGSYWFAAVAALAAVAAAREWHRMVGNPDFTREVFIAAPALVLALFAMAALPKSVAPWAILAAASAAVYVSARLRGVRPLWQASGVLYLGVPAAAIVALRTLAPHGAWVIVGVLLVVWATDTGALVAGNLIGGPRLAPVLSPNKTWSGTLGGIATAAIVEAIYVGVLGGDAALGAVYAVFVSIVAHGGDLFESWVKRCFRLKDSGGLIPGHGGVLDRIDSTLSAGAFVAIMVFAFNLDPLFGAHP